MSGAPASLARNDVATLDTSEHAALSAAWRRTIKTPPPKGISRRLMVQILTYEAQVQQRGGLKPAVRCRLAREWNGVSHVVHVTEAGLVWRGRRYRSLSAVARATTGARWSGPRFFGLLAEDIAA